MAYDAEDRVCALKALHNSRAHVGININFLNFPKLSACLDNHTIPILDKIVTEEWSFIVMPYWPRPSISAEVEDHFNRVNASTGGRRDQCSLPVELGLRPVYSSFTRRGTALAYSDLGHRPWGTVDHATPEVPHGNTRHSQPYHLPPVDTTFSIYPTIR
ncbi:hypothetical protein K438DRAFT_1790049 [Mycena galopus ATCC 62051]|nr:hypothetical protein K438DRAFT_1790049 [Mycena galopus ATCC 62051]